MKEKVNHVVIGGFVVGALVLAVVGILIFGSGKIMKKTHNHVLYFEGGLKGLSTGAAVSYRGIRIGSVVDITIQIDATDMTSHIPVVIEVEPDRFEVASGDFGSDPDRSLQKLIDKGLRAKLVTESFLTGKLMIELELKPDTPVRLLGLDPAYPEIPTIPSSIEEMRNTLLSLPVEELFTKTMKTIETIDRVMSTSEIPRAVTSLRMAADDFRKLANDMNAQVALLTTDTRDTMDNYGKLARHLDEGLVAMMAELNDALQTVSSSFEQVESSLWAIEKMVSEDSLMSNEFKKMMAEITVAARSIRELAGYLERHPEALIRGKRENGRLNQ